VDFQWFAFWHFTNSKIFPYHLQHHGQFLNQSDKQIFPSHNYLLLDNLEHYNMGRYLKIFCFLSIWQFIAFHAFSQYYVKFRGDSIPFQKDSIILSLDKEIIENLDWEISEDSQTWESLNISNDTLSIRIDTSAFYRAVYKEGTCFPVTSDLAFAGFKSIVAAGNSIIIDSIGGIYFLPSGIKIVVPPGAVKENTMISFDVLDSLNAELKIPFDADTGRVFCAGIYCEPNAIEFLKPIKITIPAPNYHHNDLPYLYTQDPITGNWDKYTGDLLCSENLHSIEFTIDKIVSTRIQLVKDVFEFENLEESARTAEDPCQQGFINVKSEAHDHVGQKGSKECYVSSDKTKVIFLECPGQPVHDAKIEEIGKDCEPEVVDNLGALLCIKSGERVDVDVTITIGGKPLEKQDIQFYDLPNGLIIDEPQKLTDENGKATFTFTCSVDNFSGIIYYKVYYKYFLEIIEASDGTHLEKTSNHERNGIIENKGHLIKECPRVKSIVILADRELKVGGEPSQINSECRDQNNELIDCGEVEYILSNVYTFPAGNIISVSNEGVVTALKPGLASVQASVGDVISDYDRGTFSVAYQGDLKDLSLRFDNNIYKKCGCQEDYDNPPHELTWWVIDFIGSYHITFFLDHITTADHSAELVGEGIITYSISGSTHCTGASFKDPVNVNAADNSLYLLPPENGPATTVDILAEKEFNIRFDWITEIPSDWRFRSLRGKAKMIGLHAIEFTIMDFEPDVCIYKDVEGSCILQ
jgi:hypothetical protein